MAKVKHMLLSAETALDQEKKERVKWENEAKTANNKAQNKVSLEDIKVFECCILINLLITGGN